VIANCPSCGTHYKHEPPKARVRARCGRCDAELDLPRLAPYRIVVAAAPAAPPAVPAPPSLALWQDADPLPPIPEMAPAGAFESSLPRTEGGVMLDGAAAEGASGRGGIATFALWLAAGAIAGTGTSWTMGGSTLTGLAAGAAAGALAGWGWLRWTSPK
jgi:hypothetical protein